ncbi:hypothetical protein ACFFRR_007110 [Megaselia abdita]
MKSFVAFAVLGLTLASFAQAGILSGVVDTATGVVDGAVDTVTGVVDSSTGVVGGVVDTATGVVDGVVGGAVDAVNAIAKCDITGFLSSTVDELLSSDNVVNAVLAILAKLLGLLGCVLNAVIALITGLLNDTISIEDVTKIVDQLAGVLEPLIAQLNL